MKQQLTGPESMSSVHDITSDEVCSIVKQPILENEYSSPADARSSSATFVSQRSGSTIAVVQVRAETCQGVTSNNADMFSFIDSKDAMQGIYSEPIDVLATRPKFTERRGSEPVPTGKEAARRQSRAVNSSGRMLPASVAAGRASSPGSTGAAAVCTISTSGGLHHHPLSPFEPVPRRCSPAQAVGATNVNVEQGAYEEAWDLKLSRQRFHALAGANSPAAASSMSKQVVVATAESTAESAVGLYDYAYGQAWELANNGGQLVTRPLTTTTTNGDATPLSPPMCTSRLLARLKEPTAALDTDSYSTDSYDEPWDVRHQRLIEEITGGGLRQFSHVLSLDKSSPPPVPPHQRALSSLATCSSTDPPLTVVLQQRLADRRTTERSHSGGRRNPNLVGANSTDSEQSTSSPSRLLRPRHSSGSLVNNCSVVTNEPLDKQAWFHGNITRSEAELNLARHRPGSFLVRRCESNQEDFSLSIKGEKNFVHMKIIRNASKHYVLGQYSQPYSSIPEMIHHYSVFLLPIKGADQMILQNPVAVDASVKIW